MKKLELSNYSLHELSVNELEAVDGGGITDLFFGAVSAVIDFGNGIVDGYEEARIQRIIDSSPQYA